ncbi:MAG: 30S ribosomal protein S18 [Verrucomicrobia bacterium CG_4_10_14_3_um_filter_43_23]|nr:MAG: 30S ribosomal protein S18 [Verrucomicrobia bacterium CG1_02_43_26]PIP59164.1 MAG: 30S ribosomal protein S18 [Verrucomicrobia bacterium CG22_combo_CG10-13_8_21_14_all_43_17]PIX58440.1 MAG: 30S ribosomal protein S18 [Verrucomicrobia bacterium CG_4_10_14_3_um_filter_43_23]PIY60826.1 MAG: 30S ribosomal protein S18 [Verrucomicrobia bacterium CG_4_10_14_0_8_um_filter_43_34]PJA44882.1 MAG: 30S ribosomal protein S18 [Verrucomicrobia bacterium CG_4_9_14_3_um_filter_43_20]
MSTENETEQKPKHSLNPLDFTWADVQKLQRFVTGTGKILPRRITRLSAKQHRHITKTIKRARNMKVMM